MRQAVVSVLDRAANIFGRPFFVAAVGQATRSFSDEVNRTDGERSEMAKHPEDFDLYLLSWYDDSTGTFEADLRLLVRAKDLQRSSHVPE